MTDKPGVEPAGQTQDTTEQTVKSVPPKKRGLGQFLAAAAATGVVVLAISQCDGGHQTTQPSAPSSSATDDSTPVPTTQRGPYYQVTRPTLPRGAQGAERSHVSYAVGSCVSEFRDAGGRTGSHPAGLTKVHVHLPDGTAYATHIRSDDLAPLPESNLPANGLCRAERVLIRQEAVRPTYMVKDEDINLRSRADRNAPPWGILHDGSCVHGTGRAHSNFIEVEARPATDSPSQTTTRKWVLVKQLHIAMQDPCTARFEQVPDGHPGAGVTPNPWQP